MHMYGKESTSFISITMQRKKKERIGRRIDRVFGIAYYVSDRKYAPLKIALSFTSYTDIRQRNIQLLKWNTGGESSGRSNWKYFGYNDSFVCQGKLRSKRRIERNRHRVKIKQGYRIVCMKYILPLYLDEIYDDNKFSII